MRFLVFILLSTGLPVLSAEDWSRFRGPNGTGVSGARDVPVELRLDGNLLWKQPIPSGKSSPVLTDRHVVVTGVGPDGLLTLAFDRLSGRPLWQRAVPRDRQEYHHAKNSPAASTPVSNGTHVFSFFRDFGLVSYDASGTERWRRPLGPFRGLNGVSSSPILVGDVLVLVVDQLADSYIAGFDPLTGRELWRTERRPYSVENATPVVRRAPDGRHEVVVVSNQRLTAYDSADGSIRWAADGPHGGLQASAVIDDEDTVYFAITTSETVPSFDSALARDRNGDGRLTEDEYAGSQALTAIARYGGNRDGVIERTEWDAWWRDYTDGGAARSGLYAMRIVDGSSGGGTRVRPLWSHHRGLPDTASPLVVNGIVYIVANSGVLTALDATTGKVLRVGRLTGAPGPYWASPVAAGDMLFLVSEEGRVSVVRAVPDWQIVRVNELGEETSATPALADGRVFLRTDTMLYCFGDTRASGADAPSRP